jgi:hypothetical protein
MSSVLSVWYYVCILHIDQIIDQKEKTWNTHNVNKALKKRKMRESCISPLAIWNQTSPADFHRETETRNNERGGLFEYRSIHFGVKQQRKMSSWMSHLISREDQ